MNGLVVFVLLGFLIPGVASYFYVLAPNVIRFEHKETVVVGLLKEENELVQVWLERDDGDKFSETSTTISNQDKPATLHLFVKESDVITEDMIRKPKSVTLVCKKGGQTKRQDILLSYRTGHLVVQTDKPVYTPRQKVSVRVLAMDEDFRPARGISVYVEITSPSRVLFDRQYFDDDSNNFLETKLELPTRAETGIWSVRAFYGGQYTTDSQVLFAVEDYVLPTFGVRIDVHNNFILPEGQEDVDIVIDVIAKYVYKKPLKGRADIKVSAVSEDDEKSILESGSSFDQLDHNGMRQFTIKKSDLFGFLRKDNEEQQFPAGYRLRIVATVTEAATGDQEQAMDESVIFAEKKYKVSFKRSKTDYRMGMTYHLLVDVTYANDAIVTDERVTAKLFDGQEAKTNESDVANQFGKLSFTFGSLQDYSGPICFKVFIGDFSSDEFCPEPYHGKSMIFAEHDASEGRGEYLQVFSNGTRHQDTGVVFLVISLGQVIHVEYKRIETVMTLTLSKSIKQKIKSRTARFLAFYVHMSDGTLVADAVKFQIDKQCEGRVLQLIPERHEVPPGEKSNLELHGEPYMCVGLNVMDSALLHVPVHKKLDIFSKEKMFAVIDEHDGGCGEGGGTRGEHVFRNTGLTILTDASVNDDHVSRTNLKCEDTHSIIKRSAELNERCSQNVTCCEEGESFARKAENETEGHIDPFATCLGQASLLAKLQESSGEYKWPTKCLFAYYESCLLTLETLADEAGLEGKSLTEKNVYGEMIEDIKKRGMYTSSFIRERFKESFLFSTVQLDHKGLHNVQLAFPQSITNWMIQGIGITDDKGFYIAETAEVNAFKNFFLQVKLPYEAVRLEKLDIEATVFYYGHNEVTANVFLDHNPDFCSNAEPDTPMNVKVSLQPNSAQVVRFPIIPVVSGQLEVLVKAFILGAVTQMDVIKKPLFVKSEGVEENINIEVCLDPRQQQKGCRNNRRVLETDHRPGPDLEMTQMSTVDLIVPSEHIVDTVEAVGRIAVDVMEEVVSVLVKDVDGMIKSPGGCGEQNMMKLSPTVHAMDYLKRTNRMTAAFESKGHKYIEDGITHQLQYRQANGCYGVFTYLWSFCNTRLTAYVARIYCQARDINSGVKHQVENTANVKQTLDWLADQDVSDPQEVAEMAICFLKCSRISTKADGRLSQLATTLGTLSETTNLIALAQATYVFTLMNDERKDTFRNRLLDTATRDVVRDDIHWELNYRSKSIVATSYALLATLHFDDIATASNIAAWLTAQRGFRGSYSSTDDTVVAVEALTEYSVKTNVPDVNLKVTLSAGTWTHDVTITNQTGPQVFKVEVKEKVIVDVAGSGSARLVIDLRYNRPNRPEEESKIVVSDINVSPVEKVDVHLADRLNRTCDICGRCEDGTAPKNNNAAESNANKACIRFTVRFGDTTRQSRSTIIDGGFGLRSNNATKFSMPSYMGGRGFGLKSQSDAAYYMPMVKFGLETGQEVDRHSLDALQRSMQDVIDLIETAESGKNFITFYLSKHIDSTEIKFTFILKDTYTGDAKKRQPARVEAFEYYNPEVKSVKYYKTKGELTDLKTSCTGNECRCLSQKCAEDKKKKIVNFKTTKDAIKALIQYTCNYKLADYAMVATINNVTADDASMSVRAHATVKRIIHEGAGNLHEGSEMIFIWRDICTYINDLFSSQNKNKDFYIIAKDGVKVTTSSGKDRYEYTLMNTAIVLKTANNRQSKFYKIMKSYESYMITKNCQS